MQKILPTRSLGIEKYLDIVVAEILNIAESKITITCLKNAKKLILGDKISKNF